MKQTLEAMNLNLLLALHWLLVENSVTRAATRMGVTQSAMSRSLASLREHFDDPLFQTVGRRLVPTARASSLREPLGKAVSGFRALLEEPAAFDPDQQRGAVAVLATEHAMGSVVPGFLRTLRKRAPNLAVHVAPAGSDSWSRVAQGEFDILIAPKLGSTMAGLASETLFFESFRTVLRKGHPAAGKRLTLARYCALEHVVVYPRGGDAQSLVSRVLAEEGRERKVVARVPYFSSALDLVATTDLVLTLPASLVPKRLTSQKPPLALPGFALEVVWAERLSQSALHLWLRDLLHQSAARL